MRIAYAIQSIDDIHDNCHESNIHLRKQFFS